MSGQRINCNMCKTPLNGKQEFIGHHVHSHEWSLEEAVQDLASYNNSIIVRQLVVYITKS
jgi:hypothetical protein